MYASPQTLGQSFFFDLMLSEWNAIRFRNTIDRCLVVAGKSGSSVTWVLNNHDAVRTASRYGTKFHGVNHKGDPLKKYGMDWLLADGDPALCDSPRGLRRARAAALLMLGLPGSAYVYQGEELGLPEVAEIPADQRQDPSFFRNPGVDIGRDGCRVPLPWSKTGPSFGFGSGASHLPQPMWFSQYSVKNEQGDPSSTLSLYRAALRLRREFQDGADSIEWVGSDRDDVIHFRRKDGWNVLTNFGVHPYAMPAGELMLSSNDVDEAVPGETTVWFQA